MKVALRNVDSFATKLDDIGAAASDVGRKMLPVAAVVGGFGLVAIKAASDFESSFAGVSKTVDGVVDDAGQLTVLGKDLQVAFRDMAKEIPVNVNELNRIAEAGGQLGVKAEDIKQFTRTMADMGVATNLSSEMAAEGLAQIANIMDNEAGPQYDKLGNTIADLGNKSAATESQILEFGLRLAGAGKVAGLSEPEILGIGSALASVGINAEAGGTAFSKVFIELASAVSKGGNDLAEFARVADMSGTEFAHAFKVDAAGAVTSFVEGLGRIDKSGGDLFATLEKIGVSEQRMRDALLRSAGAGDLFAQSIRDGKAAWEANNALTKEAEKRYNTFASQVEKLWNRLSDVAITIGSSLLPTLRDLIVLADPVINFLTKAAEYFAALPAPIRATALALGAVAAASPFVLLAFGTLASATTAAFTAVAALVGWFAKSTAAATANAGALALNATAASSVATATKFAAGEQMAFNFMADEGAQLLLPLGGNSMKASTAMSTMATNAGKSTGVLGTLFSVLKNGSGVLSLLGRGLSMVTGPIGWIVGAGAAVLTAAGAWDELFRVFKALAGLGWAVIIGAFQKIGEFIVWVGGLVGGAGKSIVGFFTELLHLDGIASGLGGLADFIDNLTAAVDHLFGNLVTAPESPFAAMRKDIAGTEGAMRGLTAAQREAMIVPLDAAGARARMDADEKKRVAELEARTAAAAETAKQLSKEQREALDELNSSSSGLSETNYKLIASYLSMGKSQSVIAKALGVTSEQVRGVAVQEEALATLRERMDERHHQALEDNATAAKEAMDRVAAGAEAIATMRQQLDDAQAERTMTTLQLELRAIDQWRKAEQDKYAGAINAAEIFANIEEQVQEKHLAAMLKNANEHLGKQNKLTAERAKAAADAFKAIADVELEVTNMRALRNVTAHEAEILRIRQAAEAQKKAFRDSAVRTEEELRRFYDAVDKLTTERVKALSKTWQQFFEKDFTAAIMGAIQGGGNVGDAIGGAIGGQIGTSLSQNLGKSLTKVLGKTVGGAITAMLPGVGALLGSLAGKLLDGFVGMFTGGARANDLRDALKADLMTAVRGLENDPSIRAGIDFFNTAGSESSVQAGFDATMAAANRTRAAMERYGLTVEDLGSKSDQLGRDLQQVTDDFANLARAGFSIGQVSRGAAGQLSALVATALETGEKLPASLQPYLHELARSGLLTDELKAKLLGLADPVPWKEMEDAANRYGISLDDLGKKFAQAKLDDAAKQIAADWKLLADNGANVGAVMAGMKDEVNELVKKALTLGLTIPESMKPLITALFDAGQLTDANGQKLEDLTKIEFAPDVMSDVDKIIAKMDELIDTLLNGVYPALSNLPTPTVSVPNVPSVPGHGNPQYDENGNPWPTAHTGGMVANGGIRRHHKGAARILPFPKMRFDEVPAILQEGEAILNRRAARGLGESNIANINSGRGVGGGDNVTINVYPTPGMSESTVADMVIRRLPRQLKALGF